MKTLIKSSMRSTRAKMKFIGRILTRESGSWDRIRRPHRAMCRSIPVQRDGTASMASKFNLIVVHVFDELGDRAGHEGFENLKIMKFVLQVSQPVQIFHTGSLCAETQLPLALSPLSALPATGEIYEGDLEILLVAAF